VNGKRFDGKRIVAFAGIGRPEKFFATLRRLGAELAAEFAFSDHHRFGDTELAALRAAATRERALLVTTAKDVVRLRPKARAGIEVLDVRIEWRDRPALDVLLARLREPRGAAIR